MTPQVYKVLTAKDEVDEKPVEKMNLKESLMRQLQKLQSEAKVGDIDKNLELQK